MSEVITVLADGFEETEAVTCIDLLRRADIGVKILGLNSLEVRGAHDITIKAEGLVNEEISLHDGIILPGGQPGTTNLSNSEIVLSLLKRAHSKGLLCGAICAAPTVLGKAGILKGINVSCYPGTEEKIADAIITKDAVSVHGNIITSQGVGTAIEFSLAIISYLRDQNVAQKIRNAILA